jgi:hypothetical protein
MRIFLGQPGTSKATPQGVGGKQSEVHADVKAEIVKADSDLISDALNIIGRWVTRWNYGEEVKPPKVYRILDDAEDLNTTAERDVQLDSIGWRRTDAPPPGAANENSRADQARKRAQFDATDPRPLYVMRRLQNVEEFTKWARSQGFENVDDDLHVTILYSRQPVDWFSLGEAWGGDRDGRLIVPPGGPRRVEKLGDKAALVFASSDIRWRHESMIERLTAAIMDDADPIFSAFAGSIRDSLKTARATAAGGELSLEGARVALLQAFEQFEPAQLARLTGLAFVAERAAAEAGVEGRLTA